MKKEKEERFSLREMEHMAINFAMARNNGFTGNFLDYYSRIRKDWRKWLKKMDKEYEANNPVEQTDLKVVDDLNIN